MAISILRDSIANERREILLGWLALGCRWARPCERNANAERRRPLSNDALNHDDLRLRRGGIAPQKFVDALGVSALPLWDNHQAVMFLVQAQEGT